MKTTELSPAESANAFADPVAYLARFGIDSKLVDESVAELPAAA